MTSRAIVGQRAGHIDAIPPASDEWDAVERVLDDAGFSLPLQSRSAWARCMPGESLLVAVRDASGRATAAAAAQVGRSRALPGHRLLRVRSLGQDFASEAGAALFARLRDLARDDWRVIKLNLEFVLHDPDARQRVETTMRSLGFRRERTMRSYAKTLVVDLRPTESALLAGFSEATRRALRQGARTGLVVRPIVEPAFAVRLDAISRETFARTGGDWESRPWAERIRLCAEVPEHARLVGLFADGGSRPDDLLAFGWSCRHGLLAQYDDGGSVREVGTRKGLSYLVMWDLIRWAKEAGASCFDLGGVPDEVGDEHDPRGGITQFKRRFSKREVEMGMEWVYEPHPARATTANLVSRAVRAFSGLGRRTHERPLDEAQAIVLGSYETGLGIVRALGRTGVRVHVMDHQRLHATHSRYATAHACPNPAMDPAGFCDALIDLARSLGARPVVFVSADEYIIALADHRERLAEHCLFNLSPSALLARIADKHAQVQLAIEHGIPVPTTEVVCDASDVERVVARMPLPAFIKGRDVVRWRQVFGGTIKGLLVHTRDELRAALERAGSRQVPVIVQEVIPGDATQHMKVSGYTSVSGTLAAAFTLRKIRQHPHGFGFGCVVESIENRELLALGAAFFQRIGYRGTGSIEFKYDARDGQFKLIELNPRYWQQNALAARVGMNIALLEYRDLLGLPFEPITRWQSGVKWINLGRDFETARQLRQSGELTAVAWWQSLRGERIWSDMAIDDPGPGFFALWQEIVSRWRHLVRLVSPDE